MTTGLVRSISMICISFLLAGAASAQTADKATSATLPAQGENPAITFLHRAEKKNAETNSLHARFDQTRTDNIFGDEVVSHGEFWYQKPGKFHASYKAEHSSEIWMQDGKLINYVPTIGQVDIVRLAEGDEAPIHQMLLGFGAEVSKIRDVFEVSPAQETRSGLYGIDFKSQDKSRSLEYDTITIYFDEAKVEPRVIVAMAEDSTITVDLKDIEFNPAIDPKTFVAQWPENVDVIRHGED